MRKADDTSEEARRVLTAAYRAIPPERKLRLISGEFRLARRLHESGVRRLHPGYSERQIRRSWRAKLLGELLADDVRGDSEMTDDVDNLTVLRDVLAAFQSLNVAYAIGGSWASSYYGEPRMTRDVDIAVEPFPGKEQRFADHFGPDYYLSVDAMKEANALRSTFNVIHTSSAFKVDVFVRIDDPFENSMMSRRTSGTTDDGSPSDLVWLSPEDVILLKLRWYRLGNEISDRHWSDILGVMRTQSGRLDENYLNHWAGEIGVADLLVRARIDAT